MSGSLHCRVDLVRWVCALAINRKPKHGVVLWALDANAALRRLGLRSPTQSNILLPYMEELVRELAVLQELHGNSFETFQLLVEEARRSLSPSVLAYFDRKIYWTIRYRAARQLADKLRNKRTPVPISTLEVVTGWKDKSAFSPQSTIPWEDFQTGQWKSLPLSQE